jgi:hypothetical protein
MGVVQLWVHSVALQQFRPEGPTVRPDSLTLGLASFTATAWLISAVIARLYNALARR